MDYCDHRHHLTSTVSRRAPRYVLYTQDLYRHPCLCHCRHHKKPYLHQMDHSNRHKHELLELTIRSWRPLLILITLLHLLPPSRFHPYCLHLNSDPIGPSRFHPYCIHLNSDPIGSESSESAQQASTTGFDDLVLGFATFRNEPAWFLGFKLGYSLKSLRSNFLRYRTPKHPRGGNMSRLGIKPVPAS